MSLNINNLHHEYAQSDGQSSRKSGLEWAGEGGHAKRSSYFSTRECQKGARSVTRRLSQDTALTESSGLAQPACFKELEE